MWEDNFCTSPFPHSIPFDDKDWGVVKTRACANSDRKANDLKASINQKEATISMDYTRHMCTTFRPRLEPVVANGIWQSRFRYFEVSQP